MNATNRALNRLILLIGGLLLAAAGASALLWVTRPVWAEGVLRSIERSVREAAEAIAEPTIEVGAVGDVPVAAVVAVAVSLVLAVALIVFVFTRGRGHVHEVVRMTAPDGRTDVDRDVVDAVLVRPLSERPDVLSARTGVYGVRGTPTVRLSVTVRQGASLGDVLAAARHAVQDWDVLLGSRTPVLVHLTDRGWLARYRSAARVR